MTSKLKTPIAKLLAFCKQVFVSRKLSLTTRKLYLADIRNFLLYLDSREIPLTGSSLGKSAHYTQYLGMLKSRGVSPAMLNRTLAALKQLGQVVESTYNHSNPLQSLTSTNKLTDRQAGQPIYWNYIKFFLNYLNASHLSPLTVKSYKSDLTQYLTWISKHSNSTNIKQVLTSKNIENYLDHLRKSQNIASSSIERKFTSLTRFATWFESSYPSIKKSHNKKSAGNGFSDDFKLAQNSADELPQNESVKIAKTWMARYESAFRRFRFSSIVTYVLLVLLVTSLAIYGYQQFYSDRVLLTQAYPTTPVTPNRQLSFQGRLEDSGGTPITSSTNFVFKLWDDPSVGSQLYTTGTCAIQPDSDGIFSTQIGDDCGSGIPATVFTENSNVYLEVTVGAEVLDPRQQIATVAYALNAETIQGIPISATMSAITNTVVPMNQWGEIIVGEQSPRLRGVAGTFQISAPALSLTTNTGTNGNITIAPDGTGQVNVQGNTTSTNFFNVSNAQLTTGSLITGTAANDNTGFNLINLLSGSSPTSKFSVTDAGLTTIGDDLYVSGGISLFNNAISTDYVEATGFCTGDGETNCVTDFSSLSSGASIWTDAGTYIYPTNGETLGNSTSAGANKLAGLYLADSSPLVFGTDNDVTLQYSSGSTVGLTGSLTVSGSSTLGDANTDTNILRGLITLTDSASSYPLRFGADVDLYRGAADNLYLATGDSLTLVSGNYTQTSPASTGTAFTLNANALTTGTGIQINSSTLNGGVGLKIDSSIADVTATTSLLDLEYSDVADPDAFWLRIFDSSAQPELFIKQSPGGNAYLGLGSDLAGSPSLDVSVLRSASGGRVGYWARNSNSAGWSTLQLSNDASINDLAEFGVGGTTTTTDVDADRAYVRSWNGLQGISLISSGATHDFRIFTGGATTAEERLRINSSGNVGIGTTTPTALLDVAGTASSSGTLAFRGTTDPKIDILNGEYLGFRTSVGGDIGLTERFSIQNNGDIYIADGLSLFENAVSDGTVEATKFCTGDGETNCVTDFSSLGGSSLWTDGTGYLYPTGGEVLGNSASAGGNKLAGLYLADSSPLVFGTDNDVTYSFSGTELGVSMGNNDINFDANTLFIDGSANKVGIGTNLPGSLLTIGNTSTTRGYITLNSGTAANQESNIYSETTGGLHIDTYSNSFPIQIDGSKTILGMTGNVGIGTSNPNTKLEIYDSTWYAAIRLHGGEQGLIQFGHDNATAGTRNFNIESRNGNLSIAKVADDWSAVTGYLLSIQASSGNVGIGDTSPASLLTVGNGDLFQVNSSGIIAAIDGVAHTIDDVSGDLTLTSNSTNVSIADGLKVSGTITANGGLVTRDSGNLALSTTTSGNIVLTSAGNITLTGFNCSTYTNGGTLTTDASGIVSCANDDGGGGAGGSWQETLGSISPNNSTWDVLIGGTATSSAKIGFMNINSGTPTINLANQASNLAIKDNTASAFKIVEGANTYLDITTTDNAESFSLNLPVGGVTSQTANLFTSNIAKTINLGTGTAIDTINIGNGATGADVVNIGSANAGNVTINSASTIALGSNTGTSTTNILSGSGGININANNNQPTNIGTGSSTGTITLGGTGTQTLALGNGAGVKTVNLGSSNTTSTTTILSGTGGIAIGDFANTKTISIGGNTNSGTDTINIATNSTAADVIAIGNNNAATTLALTGGTAWNVTTTGTGRFGGSIGIGTAIPTANWLNIAAATSAKAQINLTSSAGTNPSSPTSGDLWWNGTNLNFRTASSTVDLVAGATGGLIWTDEGTYIRVTNGEVLGNSAAAGSNKLAGIYLADSSPLTFGTDNDFAFSFNNTTSTLGSTLTAGTRFGINTTNALATLDVRGSLGTIPVASISGNTSMASLIVDQSGSGDILAASSSGETRFVVKSNGNVGIGVQNPTSKLQIGGATSTISNSSGDITINAASNNISFSGDNLINIGDLSTAGQIGVGGVAPTTSWLQIAAATTGLAQLNLVSSGGTDPTTPNNGDLWWDGTSLNFYNGSSTTNLLSGGGGGSFTDAGSYLYPTGGEYLGNNASAGANKLAGIYLADSAPLVFGTDNDVTYTFSGTELGVTLGNNDLNFDSNTLFIDGSANKVAIGAPSPALDAKFQVTGAAVGKALAIFDNTGNQDILVASASGSTRFRVATDGFVYGARYVDSANSSYYLDPAATGTSLMIDGNIVSDGAFSITSNGTNGNITINAGTGTVFIGSTGAGKLDAGTIDPPYTINGERYATYLSGMTGVKEETTGTIQTSEFIPGMGYRATLSFAHAQKDSDLWLFSKVTDLKNNFDNLVVLLSPGSDTQTWYQAYPEYGEIDIFTSSPARVSYRLTAPRFDATSWTNTRDSDHSGFVLTDNTTWSPRPLTIAPSTNMADLTILPDPLSQDSYSLVDLAGNAVSSFISASNGLIASLTAGRVETQELISPLISTNAIETDTTLVISRSQTSDSDAPVLQVQGEISASTISARLATLDEVQTHRLVADEIVARKITAENIEGLDAKLASLSAGTSTELSESEVDSITDRIRARIDSLTGNTPSAEDLPAPVSDTPSLMADLSYSTATGSADLASADIDFATINDYLVVIGTATMTELEVNGTLYASSLQAKDGLINLANNTLLVDSSGQVAINGDLTVNGTLLASSASLGSLNLGTPIDATASSQLGSLLAVYNEQGQAVASIDASGSANLAGLSTNLITIAAATSSATSTLITTSPKSNATAGEAILPAHSTELVIESPYVTANSLIYLTPTGHTDNKVLFVKTKNTCVKPTPTYQTLCTPSFTIAVDSPTRSNIPFNWWIIQLDSGTNHEE